MSKRTADSLTVDESEVVEEGELGKQTDIWVEHVFPILHKKEWATTSVWLQLGLVSKTWLLMTSKTKEHEFSLSEDYFKCCKQVPILTERFPSVVKLETMVSFGTHLTMFKSLRILTIYGIYDCHQLSLHALTNLTSLTVGPGVTVIGIEFLEKLEELSLMYLDNYTHTFINLSEHKNIKRLHLGKSDGDAGGVTLSSFIPVKSTLEYIECAYLNIFNRSNHTGMGKCRDRFSSVPTCYEGEWLNGLRHGNGTLLLGDSAYSGKWEDDEMKSGKVVYGDGSYYEGEFGHTYDVGAYGRMTYNIFRHGRGRLCRECDGRKTVYKGEFKNGMRHGKGSLYENGKFFYKGEWVYDTVVSVY